MKYKCSLVNYSRSCLNQNIPPYETLVASERFCWHIPAHTHKPQFGGPRSNTTSRGSINLKKRKKTEYQIAMAVYTLFSLQSSVQNITHIQTNEQWTPQEIPPATISRAKLLNPRTQPSLGALCSFSFFPAMQLKRKPENHNPRSKPRQWVDDKSEDETKGWEGKETNSRNALQRMDSKLIRSAYERSWRRQRFF